MNETTFACFLVRKLGKDRLEAGIERRSLVDLPDGDLLVRVEYSSLNYKDALAASGHPGIVRGFPHVPGIDAVGTVVESRTDQIPDGARVILNGHEFGALRWGGWAGFTRVPVECAVPLPEQLSAEEAMRYGTAGFTAALSVRALQHNGVTPGCGEIVVTGATGGVGCLAVKLLARLGYTVAAVTGKRDRHDWLRKLGADVILGRDDVNDTGDKPLLAARWAAAVDSVGGNTLATILRSTRVGGSVTACGLVAGAELPLTVYPFILRGVTLAGIDSNWCPHERRVDVWHKLANEWKLDGMDELSTTVTLEQLQQSVRTMLDGHIAGRVVVRLPEA